MSLRMLFAVVLLLVLGCLREVHCAGLTAELRQQRDTQLLLSFSSPITFTTSLSAIQSGMTILAMSSSTGTITFTGVLSQPSSSTIQINLSIPQSIVYTTITVSFTSSVGAEIIGPSATTLSVLSYTTLLMYYNGNSSLEETLIQTILPIALWTLLGGMVVITLCQLLLSVDTAASWVFLDAIQILGILSLLGVTTAPALMELLQTLNIANLFFINSYVFDLIKIIFGFIQTTPFNWKVLTSWSIPNAPQTVDFFQACGNTIGALIVMALVALTAMILGFKKNCCRLMYRAIDVLVINIVYGATIQLRWSIRLDMSVFSIIEAAVAGIACIGYAVYGTILPWRKVNTSEVIMLDFEAIEEAKHFINKQRVECFFSRNYFSVRVSFKIALAIAVAVCSQWSLGKLIVGFVVVVYTSVLLVLKFMYRIYEARLIEWIWCAATITLLWGWLSISALAGFEVFFQEVSRSASSQFDQTYLALNRYASWILVTMFFAAYLLFLTLAIAYTVQEKRLKGDFIAKETQDGDERSSNDTSRLDAELIIEMTADRRAAGAGTGGAYFASPAKKYLNKRLDDSAGGGNNNSALFSATTTSAYSPHDQYGSNKKFNSINNATDDQNHIQPFSSKKPAF